MNARIIIAMAAFAIACNDAGGAGPSDTPSCITPTAVFSGMDAYDALAVQNGFVYVEIPGTGVARCPTTGCSAPASILDSESFISASLGGPSVAYTTQIASADEEGVTGEIRSIGIDGSGDQSILAGLTYPAYVATTGNRTFWAQDSFALDDTPATIHCVGCNGATTSTPWMSGLTGGTYGMLVDGANVYVLADDPTQTSITLFACSINAPCFSEPRIVVGNLDPTLTAQQIASDGVDVYVARPSVGDVVRVDASGVATPVVTAEVVTALVVDASTGDLYFGTAAGEVARTKTDGSTQPTSLACSSNAIAALAVDDVNVYMLTGLSASDVMRAPK